MSTNKAKKLREVAEWVQRRRAEQIPEKSEYEQLLRSFREDAEQGRTRATWGALSQDITKRLETDGFTVKRLGDFRTLITW